MIPIKDAIELKEEDIVHKIDPQFLILAILIMVLVLFGGCASTKNADIEAYGIYSVSPMGMIGLGWISWQRSTKGGDELKEKQVPDSTSPLSATPGVP